MKLGIIADEISLDFRRAVEAGKKIGLRRFEIRFLKSGRVPVCDAAELREVERIRDGEGVEITAISPGLFKWTDNANDFRREMNEVFPRAAELAVRWRLASMIIFGFHKPGATEENGDTCEPTRIPAHTVEWMTKAAELAAQHNLNLLIESEPVCYADTLANTVALIRQTNADNLGINYDAGNLAWMSRRDEPEKLRAAASLVGNVHVKDLLPAPLPRGAPVWVVPGNGMIDYQRHFEILREGNYQGSVSLEPHIAFNETVFAACRDAVLKFLAEGE